MPLLQWLARLARATVWMAVHLTIASALLLLSAYFFTSGGADDANGGYFFRFVGSVWLYAAAYSYIARGILQRRPAAPLARGEKPTTTAVVRNGGGCVLIAAAIGAAFVLGGRMADWAWAGIAGPDERHPARVAADRLLYTLQDAAARPEAYAPYAIVLVVAMLVLGVLGRAASPTPPTTARQARRPAPIARPGSTTRSTGGKRKGHTGSEANAAALATAAAAASARTTDNASATSAGMGSRLDTREDRVLGTLFWSGADGAWQARNHDASHTMTIRIEADPSGPTTHQIDLARAAVQRHFELQLRASDAARPRALSKGVGLPRFTIAAISVGADADAATPVTVHLRCEGDTTTDYAVRSTDGMRTFKL
ncbi:MAG: hypothetical protein H0V80_17535 [Acidobacteria bacterium]|nr:hypothetical protein [Acidobacteriota bacterium]